MFAIFGLAIGAVTASAADMAVKARPIASDPAFNWSGYYVGLNAGYGWGSTDVQYAAPGAPFGFLPLDIIDYSANGTRGFNSHGFTGGGQAGFNYQWGRYVAGIEGDVGYLGRSGRVVPPLLDGRNNYGPQAINYSGRDGWLATVRGRVGIAFDRFLVFGTGGVAFTGAGADLGNTFNANGFGLPFINASTSSGNSRVGWTAGGGVEYAFAPNWSVKAEYLRVEFSNDEISVATPGMINSLATVLHGYRVDLSDNLVRIGLNYKLSVLDARY